MAIEIPPFRISVRDFTETTSPIVTYTKYTAEQATQISKIEAALSLTLDGAAANANDDISYREISKTAGTYTFSLTNSEKQTLINAIPADKIATDVRYLVKITYINGATGVSSDYAVFTLTNIYPTVSPTVEDINTRTLELTGNKNVFIKYYSNAKFTVGASGGSGASIQYRTIKNGSVFLDDYTSDTGVINAIESNTFYFTAVNSRGLSVNGFKVVELIPYVKLTNSLSVSPMTTNGVITFTIKGKYFKGSFGAKSNSLEVEYLLTDRSGNAVGGSGSGWVRLGTVSPSVSGDNYSYSYTITGLNYNEQYELTVNAIDELTPVQAATTVIATTPLFDWSDTDFHHHTEVHFSNDLYIKDELLADYVIEQGSSGSWNYRKWASGKVDLAGTLNISNLTCNTALGGWYRTAVLSSPSFPFSIINPIVTATYESAGYGALVWATTNTDTSKPFDFYLIRPTSSAAITGKVNYSVSGSWKGVL